MTEVLHALPEWAERTIDFSCPSSAFFEGVDLILGEKKIVEQWVVDARLHNARRRRASAGGASAAPQYRDPSSLSWAARGNGSQKHEVCNHRTIVNYFQGLKSITLKATMLRTLLAYYGGRATLFQVVPASYVLMPVCANYPDDRNDFFQEVRKLPHTTEASWVAKSSHGSHGTGIFLADGTRNSILEMLKYIDDQAEPHPWVVQKYVSRPLLYHGRKFDLRCWVLLMCPFEIYLYRECAMRLCSSKYDASDVSNLYQHITNHCLQKDAPGYGAREAGNELWKADLEHLLQEHVSSSAGSGHLQAQGSIFAEVVAPQLRKIVVDTLLAGQKMTNPDDARHGVVPFQLLGYDFLIDENLKVWLLEINGAPGVADRLVRPMAVEVVDFLNTFFASSPSRRPSGGSFRRGDMFELIHASA